MMAAWKPDTLTARLGDLATPVLLIAAEDDLAVPARISREAVGQMPKARLHLMPRGGHLVREVDADAVRHPILAFLRTTAAQPSA